MQVLGDLICLPSNSSRLPLPWWHRAPLGLQSKTWVYISLIPSPNRPTGDLIISVLDPFKWPETIAVQCRRNDLPGVVSDAIKSVQDTNIALAESVTIESGEEHEVTLICETPGEPETEIIRTRLIEQGFKVDTIMPYPARDVIWSIKAEIRGGWIRPTPWREELKHHFSSNPGFDAVDLSKAIVSADTGNRLLRFVFPFKGARTIKVEHRDTPGAMKKVTDVFFRHELNVLSLLLRRGGAKPHNAILVTACEPPVAEEPEKVYDAVLSEIKTLPARFMTEVSISEGLGAASTVAPREPRTIRAKLPENLAPYIKKVKKEIVKNGGGFPVFFSRRFVSSSRAKNLASEVKASLKNSGCVVLEARPWAAIQEQNVIFSEVSAKMWVAKAGIVLVTGVEDADALGKNLPHEFGFLQGQTKPILLLAEEQQEGKPSKGKNVIGSWSNIDGVYTTRYGCEDVAVDRTSDKSIYYLVGDWIEKLMLLGV